PGLRGRGFAGECVGRLLEVARRYPTTGLVSVCGTAPFWARFGFVAEPADEDLSQKLHGYGEGAAYLTRPNHLGDSSQSG
ncbi:hypothetical protein IMZ48_07345, partial [Candidatus Bathyarchaeota archaeon]|nr:hypothetical protein [Candidatus Bathyarchaeota archaeon]